MYQLATTSIHLNIHILLTLGPQTLEKYLVKPSEQPFKYSLRLQPVLPTPSTRPIEKMATGSVSNKA